MVECKYTEDWDLNKKRSVAKQISSDDYILMEGHTRKPGLRSLNHYRNMRCLREKKWIAG